MTASKERILRALHDGQITREEANGYLEKVYDTTVSREEHRANLPAYAVFVIMVGLLAFGAFQPGITGMVTLDLPEENVTELPVNMTVTAVHVSGVLQGEGTAEILFRTPTGNYTVANITSDPGTVRTTQPSYFPGEDVTLDHAPEGTYYLDDGNLTPVDLPFPAPAVGEYELLVIANESGNLSTQRISLIVSETPVERTTTFEQHCEETCTLPPTNGTIHVVTTTTLRLDAVDVQPVRENLEPELVVPFDNLTITTPVSIDLGQHFVDPEGEDLLFSTSIGEYVTTDVQDDILTITPVSIGDELFIVYASDLEHLVQAIFHVSVEINETTNETNATPNETGQETNLTVTPTIPLQNVSENVTLRCDDPNPNLRPVECLQLETEEYFPQEDIFWEDQVRTKVAKFNQIGNLLIKGNVIEYSSGTPKPLDFKLGNVDRDGNLVATIWIDGTTGDLHLKGRLQEEIVQMQPPLGSYSIITRRSIYLAWADLSTGDMHLRGNLIPYRRSIA